MEKINPMKDFNAFYKQPKNKISLVDLPLFQFLMIDGRKSPNENPEYSESVSALYTVAYTLKFMVKKGPLAVDFKVMPLEGLWWADNMEEFSLENRENWMWTMMILQPDFLTQNMFEEALAKAKHKKKNPKLEAIQFGTFEEGLSMQIFYQGLYGEEERETIQKLHAWINKEGYTLRGKHHEIYFNSPLRTAPENLKTIIRQPVMKK